MRESIRCLFAISLSCVLFAHSQTVTNSRDTHLEKFVGELSILSRLVGGISVQSKLATHLSTITTELVGADLTRFSNVSIEPIVKTIEGLFEKSQKLVEKSDFETITTAVHLLNSLVKKVVVFEEALDKNSMKYYEREWTDFKKIIDRDQDNPDPLNLDNFDKIHMKDVFDCVESELQPSELSWCYRLLKNAADTYDVDDLLKKSIEAQQTAELKHYLSIAKESQSVFDKWLVVNGLRQLFENKKTLSVLESLLNESNKDLRKYEQVIKMFDLKVSDSLNAILEIPTNPVFKEARILDKLLANGVHDLEALPEDLKGEFLKENVAGNEENMQKLVDGLAPLLKYSKEIMKAEKAVGDWKSSTNRTSLENIGKMLTELNKWKQLSTFSVDAKLSSSIKTCLVDLPEIIGPFNLTELEHTKSTVEKLASLTSGFVAFQHAVRANGTLIYNGFEILLKVVRLHLKEMGSEDPVIVKEAFDKTMEELKLDPEYVEFEKFYAELLAKYKYPSSQMITQAFKVDPKLGNYKDIVKREKGKKVLKVIKCLSNENFSADNLEVILSGARGMSKLASSSSDVRNSIDYLGKVLAIQKSYHSKETTVRKRREVNGTAVEKLNQFGRETEGNLKIQAGERVMENILAVQRNENVLKEALKFETDASDEFYKRWKNVARKKVEVLVEDVGKLEDFIDHHKSDGLHRMVDVMNEASKVKGVAFQWDGMDSFFKSMDPEQPEIYGNFTTMKQMDLNFASKQTDFQAAVMSLKIVQQFFDRFFDVKRSTEQPNNISFFTSQTVGPSILLVVGVAVSLVVLGVVVSFVTPLGRRRVKRWYLQRNGTQEVFELYWRYSYWTDQESEKNQLCEAIREVNYELAKSLVSRGVYINVYNSFGNTPLHAATKYGLADMVEMLIKNGADRKAYNCENKTPEQMLLDCASTTSRMNTSESMSTSSAVKGDVQKKIEQIYAKYRHKQFRQRIPNLLPTMLFHIRIDGHIKKNATKLFMKKYRGNVTDLMAGVTHLIVPTDNKGVFSSDEFSHIMCVFLPTLLMQEQWMRACLEKKSNFRDDYKFRVEKVRYKGKEHGTVLKWAQWVHKQTLPFLFGVQLHLCAEVGEAVSSQLRQLVEMHGATWCEEVPVKEQYNIGSHPFHHFHLGPLFVIHSNNVPNLESLEKDEMYTLMTFDGFVEFMLSMKVKYDPERRPAIPVRTLAIDGPSEAENLTTSRLVSTVASEAGPASVASQKA